MTAPVGSAASLKAATGGSLLREDVMEKIWEKNIKETVFTDLVGSDTCSNTYTEWTEDTLAAPSITNAVIEGSDASTDDTRIGTRLGNHTQIARKVVKVTHTAEATDKIGRASEVAYQLTQRQLELARDIEATVLSNQGSVAGNADATAGKLGSFGSFLATNEYGLVNNAVTVAGAGGFNTTTKVTADIVVAAAANKETLKQSVLLTAAQASYIANGNVTVAMSVPEVIALMNAYLVAGSGAQRATLQAQAPAVNNNGVEMTAQGYVDVFKTNFGTTLQLVPNRIQQKYGASDATSTLNMADLFLVDPDKVMLSYLRPYTHTELAKLGSAERYMIETELTVKVPLQSAHAVIRNIDVSAAMTA